jgi:hypothetical protein
MAVYKRTYQRYTGELTPSWSRFLILYRYSRQTLLRSRLLTGFYVLCFFYPLLCAIEIYLLHNLDFVAKYGLDITRFLAVDNRFFFYFMDVQGVLAFILTAFTGPGLVSHFLCTFAVHFRERNMLPGRPPRLRYFCHKLPGFRASFFSQSRQA